jgi:membrane fusion protein, multidrug efflux system
MTSSKVENRQPKSGVRTVLQRATACLALGIFGLAGCDRKAPAPPPAGPVPVSVVTVKAEDVAITSEWVGTLDGFVNAQIQPQVSGYLVRQNYREGSSVSKGDVLFQIDPRPFQATLDQALGQLGQAKGQLGQAQAQFGLAKINLNRDTPLAEQHAIAQSQLDNDKQQAIQAEASVKAAEAAIASAQANVESARLNLGFTQVRSLISGIAGQATAQVGNLVSPQSVLTSVSQMDPIKVYFSLSDSEYLALIGRARKGKGDLLKDAMAIPLSLRLANGDIFPQKGHIAFIDRQMNQQTGAIRIAATFPNPGNVLRPGQFGRVSADTEVRHNVLLVPQVGVQDMQGVKQVFVAGDDNKVHVLNVTLGSESGTSWIVTGGLPSGSRVIVDNVQKLQEGVPVAPHAAAITPQTTSPAGR